MSRIYGNKIIDPVVRLGQSDLITRNAHMNGLYYDEECIIDNMSQVVSLNSGDITNKDCIEIARSILNSIKVENGVMDSIYQASDTYMYDELYGRLVLPRLVNIHRFDHSIACRLKNDYMACLQEEGFNEEAIQYVLLIDSKLPETLPSGYWEYLDAWNAIILNIDK